nr:hypothetical protein [Tanacetum cinerariifolium]
MDCQGGNSMCTLLCFFNKHFSVIYAKLCVSLGSVVTCLDQQGNSKLSRWIREVVRSTWGRVLVKWSVLSACTHMGLVKEGRVYIGLMRYVYKIDRSPDHYACMVDLLGRASCLDEAFDFVNLDTNDITFLCVLFACTHVGLVEEGRVYIGLMRYVYKINRSPDHYACMVDLLGQASCLDEAFDFVNSMLFKPHSRVLGALLSASRTHCRLDLAQIIARHISKLEPDNATHYVILSDIYLFSKKKDDEELVRTLKRLKRVKKSLGCSLIMIKDDVNLFCQEIVLI